MHLVCIYKKQNLKYKGLQNNIDMQKTQKISYNAAKQNSKLTDFEQTKALVLNNAVKNVPETNKTKSTENENNAVLDSFF